LRIPLDRLAGDMSAMPGSPTSSRHSSTRASISSSVGRACSRIGYAMFSRTEIESKSAAPWNNMPMRRRTSVICRSFSPLMTSPSKRIWPPSTGSRPISSLSMTLLPMPEPPMMVSASPSWICRSRRS